MKTKFLLSTVLVLTLSLAACAPKAAAPTQKSSVAVPPLTKPTTMPTNIVKAVPTTKPTIAPTQEAALTPTTAPAQQPFSIPTPGPALFNDIVVHDQSVQSGDVLISMVDALKPGWVAIFTDDNGQAGKVLGYTAVPEGTSSDIKVTVDTKSVPSKMIAMLLVDAGTVGTFEYPGADEPVKNANISTAVMAVFNKVSATSQ